MQLIVSVYPCDYQGDLVITAMGKSPLARGSAEVSNLEEAVNVIETVARPFRKTVNAQIYWRAEGRKVRGFDVFMAAYSRSCHKAAPIESSIEETIAAISTATRQPKPSPCMDSSTNER